MHVDFGGMCTYVHVTGWCCICIWSLKWHKLKWWLKRKWGIGLDPSSSTLTFIVTYMSSQWMCTTKNLSGSVLFSILSYPFHSPAIPWGFPLGCATECVCLWQLPQWTQGPRGENTAQTWHPSGGFPWQCETGRSVRQIIYCVLRIINILLFSQNTLNQIDNCLCNLEKV